MTDTQKSLPTRLWRLSLVIFIILLFPAWVIHTFIERSAAVFPATIIASILLAIALHVFSRGRITTENDQIHDRVKSDPECIKAAKFKRTFATSIGITIPIALALAYAADVAFNVPADAACAAAGACAIIVSFLIAKAIEIKRDKSEPL